MEIKTRLTDLFQLAYEEEQRFIASLGDHERSATGTPERWSAKDVIAHVAAWKARIAASLATARRGDPIEHFVNIPCGAYTVPTVALELRLVSELYRNRSERYLPLIQFMQIYGCDTDLLRRGMVARGISPVRRPGWMTTCPDPSGWKSLSELERALQRRRYGRDE